MISFSWRARVAACTAVFALLVGYAESRPAQAGKVVRKPDGTNAIAGEQHDATSPTNRNESSGKDVARTLFIANCATCHGESGDGKGATKLEKPARSFKDGGFSYGNTPEALLRTITNGIPGTPMPSFSSALKEDQRTELARYVISLGPPETKVNEDDTILVVRDRPLFLRGKLPAIVEGAPERPRGLLVGTTDGFTFEYRVDDVRLLGVRQGAFVERMDWSGRGGDPQKPLGKLVYVFGDGNPGPTFALHDTDNGGMAALSARFSATFARDGRAWLAYLLYADTQPLRTRQSWVEESPRARASAIGSGFSRTFNVEDLGTGGRYSLCISSTKGAKTIASADESVRAKNGWIVRARPDGTFEILLAHGLTDKESFTISGDEVRLEFNMEPGSARAVEAVTLLAPAWDAEVQAKWTKELQ